MQTLPFLLMFVFICTFVFICIHLYLQKINIIIRHSSNASLKYACVDLLISKLNYMNCRQVVIKVIKVIPLFC